MLSHALSPKTPRRSRHHIPSPGVAAIDGIILPVRGGELLRTRRRSTQAKPRGVIDEPPRSGSGGRRSCDISSHKEPRPNLRQCGSSPGRVIDDRSRMGKILSAGRVVGPADCRRRCRSRASSRPPRQIGPTRSRSTSTIARSRFRELHDLAARAAKGLQALGVGPGVHVGLHLPNTPHYVVCFFAVLMAGGRVVNFSPLAAPRELKYQLADSDAQVMVTLGLPDALSADRGAQGHREVRDPGGLQPRGLPAGADRARFVGPATSASAGRAARSISPRSSPMTAPMRAIRTARSRTRSRCCNTPAAPPASPRARC